LAYKINPFIGKLNYFRNIDTSGFVPYTGATANLNLGLFNIVDNTNLISIDPDLRSLYNSVGDKNLNYGIGQLLSTTTTIGIDWVNSKAYYPDGTTVSVDYGTGKLHDSTLGNITIDYHNRTLLYNGVSIVDWQTGYFSDTFGGWAIKLDSRHLMDTTGNYATVDWGVQVLNDGSGIKAAEWTTSQRQLFDFGGSYPTVDFGTYGLFNIGLTNNGPLVDWSTGAGGVKIYSYYSGGYHNSGDFVNYQLNNPAGITFDWALRICYDNMSAVSIDWDYHILSYSGNTTVDWQNKYLMHNGGGGNVNSIEWGNFKCMNSGGFTSVDYGNHQLYDVAGTGAIMSADYSDRKLYATDGTTVVLNWQTQQTSSGAQTATGTWGATEQTMLQEAYDALRAYGLLS
jgi:hypothetical protein